LKGGLKKMVKAATAWVDKQLARVRVAGDDYKKGVEAPERNPIEAALAANDKRINKLKESIEKKTWENRMKKVTIEDWKKKASTIGADRFIPGVEANVDKISSFVNAFQPKLSSLQASVRAMPEATDVQRESRMLANLRGLKKLKGAW